MKKEGVFIILLLTILMVSFIAVYAGPGPPPALAPTVWVEARASNNNDGVVNTTQPTGTPIISCNLSIGGANFTTDPVASGQYVVIGDSGNDKMHFINTSDCSLISSYIIGTDVFSTPAIYKNLAIFGADNGKIMAVDYTTTPNPTSAWNYTTGEAVRSPPTIDAAIGRVFVGSNDNKFYCINTTNGQMLWNFTTGNDISTKAFYTSSGPGGPSVMFGSNDKKAYFLYAINGSNLRPAIGFGSKIKGAFAVNQGKLVIREGVFLHALDMSGGFVEIWNFTDNTPVVGSPAIHLNQVVIGTGKKNLYSMNIANGASIWTATPNVKLKSPAATTNGATFFVSAIDSKMVIAYDSTGGELWNMSLLNNPDSSSFIVHQGALFIGDEGGVLYKLEDEPCTTPTDDLLITEDTTICTGTHNLIDTSLDGILKTGAKDIVITCQDKTNLVGQDGVKDIAINISHDNVTVSGCDFQFFSSAIDNRHK